MKKTKKKVIICIIVIVVAIIAILALNIISETDDNSLTHLEKVENTIQDYFLTTDTSFAKIESITENILTNNYIALGENSFIRATVNSSEDLSSYKKVQEKYATIVEEKYLAGTSYEVEQQEDGNLSFEIKPWYFLLYSDDVSTLGSKLLNMTGINADSMLEEDYKTYEVWAYKAKVKAMTIINDYLEYYENRDEIRYFTFYFDGNKPLENQYLSLYYNLVGATSDCMLLNGDDLQGQDKRISEYLESAIEKGMLDTNNPLEV